MGWRNNKSRGVKTHGEEHDAYLDLRPVSSCCCSACILDCFSYWALSIAGLGSWLAFVPWKPAEEITPADEFMFWSTLVWLLCPSFTNELVVGVMGDARPWWPCTSGLARSRWFPVWLLVKCWYRLPWLAIDDDETDTDMVGLVVCIWTWFVLTIVDTDGLLLVLLLLFVGNWTPGTVADNVDMASTGCWRSSFIFTPPPPLLVVFAWMFCVITCDLLLLPLFATVDVVGGGKGGGGDDKWVDEDDAFEEAAAWPPCDEWMTFGFTFCKFGSPCVTAAAGVDCEFKSVRA